MRHFYSLNEFSSEQIAEFVDSALAFKESPYSEVLERRLKKAEDEYRERVKYDHVVINDQLDRAVAEVRVLAGLGEEKA